MLNTPQNSKLSPTADVTATRTGSTATRTAGAACCTTCRAIGAADTTAVVEAAATIIAAIIDIIGRIRRMTGYLTLVHA